MVIFFPPQVMLLNILNLLFEIFYMMLKSLLPLLQKDIAQLFVVFFLFQIYNLSLQLRRSGRKSQDLVIQ